MDQQNPNDPNSGIGTGTQGDTGSGGTSTGAGYASGGTGTGMSSGGGMTTGSGSVSGGGYGSDVGTGGSINSTGGAPINSGAIASGGAPIGVTSGSAADTFATGGTGSTSGSGQETGHGLSGETGTHGATDAPDQFCTHCGHSLGESKGIEQFLGRLGISGEMFSNMKNVDLDEYLNTAREYLKGGTTKVTTYTKENPAKVAAGVAALALGAGLIYAAVNRDKGETTLATTGFDTNPDIHVNRGTSGTTGYDAAGDISVNRTGDLNPGSQQRDGRSNSGYDPNRT